MTTPAALAPAFAACPAISSIEAAAILARPMMSSRSAISPMLMKASVCSGPIMVTRGTLRLGKSVGAQRDNPSGGGDEVIE